MTPFSAMLWMKARWIIGNSGTSIMPTAIRNSRMRSR
jgi:hypothetical protein